MENFWKSCERKNAVEFFDFILYSETSLKLLLFQTVLYVCVCECVDSLGFLTHKILSSEDWNNFISSFLISMTFISFSLIFALAWTSSLVLDRSEESRHPYHVHDLRGKTFSFSTLRMLMVSFSVSALYEVEDILLYS